MIFELWDCRANLCAHHCLALKLDGFFLAVSPEPPLANLTENEKTLSEQQSLNILFVLRHQDYCYCRLEVQQS